jgi:hypothetical protein
MYIILSWIGWSWFAIAGTFVAVALHRQQAKADRGGWPVAPAEPIPTEAEGRP